MKIDITIDTNINKCDSDNVISKYMTEFSNSNFSGRLVPLKAPFLIYTRQFFTACVSSGFRPTGLLLSRVAKLDTQAVSVLANNTACLQYINRGLSMHVIAEKIQTKVCSKCGVEKAFSEFHKCRSTTDGLQCSCKECRRQRWLTPSGVKKRADKLLLFAQGLKRCSKCNKIKPVSEFHLSKNSAIGIKPSCIECTKTTYKKRYIPHPKTTRNLTPKESRRIYLQSPSKSKKILSTIPDIDNPSITKDGYIQVECYLCGKKFKPTVSAIFTRRNAFNGILAGEANFYCSEKCKHDCPTFKFQPYKQTDPRSKIYVPKTEAEQARAAQTDKLKKAQCDKYGYNYCERCGDIIDVELHHTLPVSEYGLQAVDSDSHILLCPGCHVALHGECA